jgi:hypothetical protein
MLQRSLSVGSGAAQAEQQAAAKQLTVTRSFSSRGRRGSWLSFSGRDSEQGYDRCLLSEA